SGTTTLAGTTVNGPLNVSGTSTMAAASINAGLTLAGGARISGGLAATGSQVSLISGATSLHGGGSFVAHTDGFCIGQIWSPGPPYNRLCKGWLWANNSDGVQLGAAGGNILITDSNWQSYATTNVNSICLPVRNGASWSCGMTMDSPREVDALFALYWVPV